MAEIRLERVRKTFQDVVAVDDVSLEIADGEFLVLVGPSGCGKSTLLRMIAGLEEITAGDVYIGDRDVTDLAPRNRDVAMVFQSYALYPHMTRAPEHGLRPQGAADTPRTRSRGACDDVAELLGLADLLDRRPGQLSGGQRQRVAMGRAIVRQPQAFLLDEPLSNLDAKLRVGMRASLAQLHQRLGVTTVYVTHDQTEAMTLGQRVAVMRDGQILQVDRPQQLYERPHNLFIAAFIGSPAMNLVDATLDGDARALRQYRVPLAADPAEGGRARRARDPPGELRGRGVRARPADVRGPGGGRRGARLRRPRLLRGRRGPDHRRGAGIRDRRRSSARREGAFHRPRGRADVGAASASTIELAVDPARFQYFDPETGLRLERRRYAVLAGTPRDQAARDTRARARADREPRASATRSRPSASSSVDLGVSRLTVRAALDELVREGYLVRRRGAGTFVAEPKVAKGIDINSFSDDMRARGMTPASRTLDLRNRCPPERASGASCMSRRPSRSSR